MKKTTLFLYLLLFVAHFSYSQNKVFDASRWRMIGPHRGGRTVGAVGVPQQPNVFYIGVNNGGVWKTTDFGRTWKPIFDDQPTGSVGDIVVSASNPNVLYVASGEGIQRPDLSVGDGIYKSADGGKTWKNTGLNEAQQIGGLAIDPTNENRVFAAVLGHPYGPNTERGLYRTLNGGQTWERILYKDENTGAVQVIIDPKNPNTIYTVLWAARQGPWENAAWQGAESGLYKSTDGGNTWQKIGKGLPTVAEGLGRIGLGIAPSSPNRLYATVDSQSPPTPNRGAKEGGGIYRSDDGGESWYMTNPDEKLWGRGSDFAEIKVDPKNADVVYSANVVTWKSTDGGKNWSAYRGAPGGDDYHRIWINPDNTDIILIAADQGAIITVNGGQTFSSWYNQPTAQFYHVSTDNAFPYNVYGGQQESGSVGISSRGNDGQITFREWHPVGVEEYGYIAADPLDPNIIYGGKITRFDKRTGQTQNIAPEAVRSGKYRFVRTAPVLFSPIDPKTLYFAGNVLFKTRDGGNSWQVISPDLTRETYNVIPASVGIYTTESMKTMPRRGVIYTIAPSHQDINTIWAGTDDGLIHITRDGGKTWKQAALDGGVWSKISLLDASHFDNNSCYAAVNRIRCDDMRPHIYKTHDGGKTWKEIVNGIPANEPINAVREDPKRKGLLFAGSERAVYVSYNDGENWHSLRLNMPATSIRDLVIKDDDLVVGTHGRSFWILDDITPLRDAALTASGQSQTMLFKPQLATRVRWNTNTDTPLPQEEPAGQNPPDGAIINYFLKEKANTVTLEIVDATGKTVRTFSSEDQPYTVPSSNTPPYWIRPEQILPKTTGNQRFVWDMHYASLDLPAQFPMTAVFQNTPPDANSPWVLAGNYTVKLTVNNQTFTQPLSIRMDPRIKTTAAQLKQIHDLSITCYEGRKTAQKALKASEELRKVARYTEEGMKKVMDNEAALRKVDNAFAAILNILTDTDMPATTQTIAAVKDAEKTLATLVKK